MKILFSSLVPGIIEKGEKHQTVDEQEKKKHPKTSSPRQKLKDNITAAIGVRCVAPSSTGIELPVLFGAHFYLSLLLAHRQISRLLASGDL